MSDRIVPGESHVRTTAKAAKHGQALYAEDDDLDPDERQRGFWRERDLGNGVVLVEWVSDPGGQSPKEEESTPASRFAGIRTRDWLAPDPPRRPKRDWLAPSKPRRDWLAVREEDRPWRLPDTPRRPRDWLAPEPAAPATAPLSFGSWAHPSPSSIGLPVVGRMVPYNEWTEVDSKREGNFLERFAPGSLSKALKERGSRIRALFQHGMDSLIGRQPIADIEEMWEREDGAHFRSRLLEGSPNSSSAVFARDFMDRRSASGRASSREFPTRVEAPTTPTASRSGRSRRPASTSSASSPSRSTRGRRREWR
jgi:hypothetical protein